MHTCTSSEPAHLHLQVGEVEERDITTVMDQKNYIEEMNRYQFNLMQTCKLNKTSNQILKINF